ncbi:MAG: phage virion morphogenesis protein [Dysgonamonadaceae bacterium]|jgi:phage gpG-like protein|nr:phage virion morphogenesis protein [Dysgonamonadaceae bacterium]
MSLKDFKKDILNDVKVELADEFDQNFERKAFFTKPWKRERKNPAAKGSLMQVRGGGGLRGSIRATVDSDSVRFTSSKPYARIHNEGGEITVTKAMKAHFWGEVAKLQPRAENRTKSGKLTKAAERMSDHVQFCKAMALKKVGSKIKMPQRQFIGHAPEVDNAVKKIVNKHVEAHAAQVAKLMNPRR